ncbi:DUF421 domain-containing protein [Salinicoccus cyprini]|uniref:DUF421 domain-containing protein n=1 Tax=Salinicoccus cyprini TaxID=2493691 RepID=A0A558AZK8_9STAP|nr:YetF domain-containing protein [Salinicoccus cyprini]TVT29718.1 DUF421 domain-containing protein [Salinicoccus cyprini]
MDNLQDMLTYAVKLTTGLVGVMIVMRLIGKKELAQITPLDFIYALILGSTIEESLYESTMPFYDMLFALFYWGLLIYIIEKVAVNNGWLRKVAKGKPQLLISNGILDTEVMRKNKMDLDEVRELFRMNGIFSLRTVRYAILENSGFLSVLEYAGDEPPSRKEMGIEYGENDWNHLFVDAGKVEQEALKDAGVDEAWLRQKIEEETDCDFEDVYFAEWSQSKGFFIQSKNQKFR